MVIKVQKKERETTQSLLRRFSKSVRKSGLLLRMRQNRFFQRNKSDGLKKKAALKREDLKRLYEEKRKLGKEIEYNAQGKN
jgi:ribosomal protein S21